MPGIGGWFLILSYSRELSFWNPCFFYLFGLLVFMLNQDTKVNSLISKNKLFFVVSHDI